MKKISLFIGMLAACYIVFGQSSRNLSSFDQISAQESIKVYLTKGSSNTARIEASGLEDDEVLMDVSDGRLKIHLEDNNYRNIDVKVYVTYVSLSGLSASSSASIKTDEVIKADGDFSVKASSSGSVSLKLTAESVSLDVSSSGDIDVDLNAEELDAEMSSSGEISITGYAGEVGISASSSGEFDGYEFECDEADIKVSSGASVKITVNDELEGRASSGGSVRYKGSPSEVNANSSSGGSVKKA